MIELVIYRADGEELLQYFTCVVNGVKARISGKTRAADELLGMESGAPLKAGEVEIASDILASD